MGGGVTSGRKDIRLENINQMTNELQEYRTNVRACPTNGAQLCCAKTARSEVSNERVLEGTVEVAKLTTKLQESRLRWYEHVVRREDSYVGNRLMD